MGASQDGCVTRVCLKLYISLGVFFDGSVHFIMYRITATIFPCVKVFYSKILGKIFLFFLYYCYWKYVGHISNSHLKNMNVLKYKSAENTKITAQLLEIPSSINSQGLSWHDWQTLVTTFEELVF